MIPFLPPPLPGELWLHRVARAAKVLGRESARTMAESFFGNKFWSFGVRLPNHVNEVLAGVPEVAGLTAEEVLDGTLFHAVNPFLEEAERSDLLGHIMAGEGQGGRSLFPRTGEAVEFLMHCPACTAKDRQARHRLCFKAEHQHPASTACPECGARLVPSRARCEQPQLPVAEEWIGCDGSPPEQTTELELGIAADLRWLLQQKSTFTPGRKALSTELVNALIRNGRYNRGPRVNAVAIWRDLTTSHGPTLRRVDEAMAHSKQEIERIIRVETFVSFHRYSILGRFIGLPLPELFDLCRNPPAAPVLPERRRARTTFAPSHVWAAKAEVDRLIAADPGYTRNTLMTERNRTYLVLLASARDWLDKRLPRGTGGGAGGALVDWESRDQEWRDKVIIGYNTLLASMPEGRPRRIERRQLLRMSGIEGARRKWGWERLPKTAKALSSLCDTDETLAKKRLAYAVRVAQGEDIVVTLNQLKHLAGVGTLCIRNEAVQRLAEEAWAGM